MRTTGAALLGAGAITVVGGLTTQLVDSSVSDNVYSSPYSSSAFVVVCVIAALSHALAFAGLLGLRHPSLVGPSQAAQRGLRLALAATALMVVCELTGIPIRDKLDSDTLPTIVGAGFGLASLVFAIGTILAGRAAARDGVWRDGRRLLLLIWGLAALPLLVLGPTDLFGYGLVIWGVPMLLLGKALSFGNFPKSRSVG